MKEIEEYQRVYAQIDMDAILHNMRSMKAHMADNTQMIGVIKTDAYGHGSVPLAKTLEELDFMFGFAVATPEEAFLLRENQVHKPILILGYTFPYSYAEMIRQEIRPAVFKEDMLKELSETAVRLGKNAIVHIKVDTGMNRIGITPDDRGLSFVKKVFEMPGIEVEGIFTHFSRADEADKTCTHEQMKLFKDFTARIHTELGKEIPLKHCSNSASIVEMPEANMDAVRAGITMYGLWPSKEVREDIVKLSPALSLHSHVVYIKTIQPGQSISYGGTFTAKEAMKVATVPVGYGDGYPRSLSNRGYVLIRGQKAPILGRVCMDQFMVDVSHIEGVAEKDPVTLIGTEGKEIITAEELGELSGRFNYELVCDLGKRIPRVYVREGKIIGVMDHNNDCGYREIS